MLAASLIFLLTITLVIWQPKGLGVGWSATLGAVLALIFGVVHLTDIPLVWQIIWNATGTFVALIIISLLPGLVCLAANQWQVLLESARFGNSVAILGLATCLFAPMLGMFLLRHGRHVRPPPMRRWAYALYPAHFLLLLAIRQIIA